MCPFRSRIQGRRERERAPGCVPGSEDEERAIRGSMGMDRTNPSRTEPRKGSRREQKGRMEGSMGHEPCGGEPERMPKRIRHECNEKDPNEPHVLDGDRKRNADDFRRNESTTCSIKYVRLKSVPRFIRPRTTVSSERGFRPTFLRTNVPSNGMSRRISRRHPAPPRAPSSARVVLRLPVPIRSVRLSSFAPCLAEERCHGPPRREWLRIRVHNCACAWRTRAHEPHVLEAKEAKGRVLVELGRQPRTWA